MSSLTQSDVAGERSRIETELAAIWQEVLRVERVGPDENFFELGGHSLTGMKLVEKVAERLDVQIPVHTLFLNPTVGQLTDLVHEQARSGLVQGAV